MMPTPTVSVIVRTMGRDSLQRALDCIAAQTHRPIEIVLVDAAARGSIAGDCHGLPFLVVSQGPLNRPQAANAGLHAATGEWVCFLDEDDELDKAHVRSLLDTAAAAGAAVAYSQTRLMDERGATLRILGGPFNRAILFRSNYMAIQAVLFKRHFVTAGCRFDETLEAFEDWDFWLQLSSRGDFAFTGRPTAIYRATAGQSGAGAGPNLDRERVLRQRERLMAKWGLPA